MGPPGRVTGCSSHLPFVFPLYLHRQGSSLARLRRVLDGAAPREAPKGKKIIGGKTMDERKIEELLMEAFDADMLREALVQELAYRIDYTSIAEEICDENEQFVQETISQLAKEAL
jgi:hypothetical protein